MTSQELKTKQALESLGFNELREVSKRELDFSYKALSERYQNNIELLNGLNENYEYLSDIKRTNETIRNILYPNEKTYLYQEEIPEEEIRKNIIDNNINESFNFEELRENVKIVDKPRAINIILSLLIPLYGILEFILVRKFLPKAAKWYLICGIIGYVISFIVMFYLVL